MRRLIPQVTCDHCSTDLAVVQPTDEIVYTVGGVKTVLVADLCLDAQENLRKRISEIEVEFGLRLDTPPKRQKNPAVGAPTSKKGHQKGGGEPKSVYPTSDPNLAQELRECLECGFVSKTRSALGQHISTRHPGKGVTSSARPMPR